MVMRRRPVLDPEGKGTLPNRLVSAFLKIRRRAGKREVFDAARMKRLLRSGQPNDAYYYLKRFLPVSTADWSQLFNELLTLVGVFKTLANVAAGGEQGARIASLFANPSEHWLDSPGSDCLSKTIALMHSDRNRAIMLWNSLKPVGLDRIMDLVVRCPELQGQVPVPRKRPMLWYTYATSPYRFQQFLSRRRKAVNHAPSDILLREYLRLRLLTNQGRFRSARSRNASSRYASQHIKADLPASQPVNLEAEAAANGEFGDSVTGLVEKQA